MYNKIRYGKKKRRKFTGGVTGRKIEKYFKLLEDSSSQLQKMAEIDIDFLKNHQIILTDAEKRSQSFDGHFRST